MPNIETVTIEVTVWEVEKVEALLKKVEADPRVMSVSRIS